VESKEARWARLVRNKKEMTHTAWNRPVDLADKGCFGC